MIPWLPLNVNVKSYRLLFICRGYRCHLLTASHWKGPLDGTCPFTAMAVISLVMAAPCNRAGHYIFALWFPSFFHLLSSFFLAESQRSEIGCLPYFHTWCGLSANLECMSEMCCTRLAENTGRKNRHYGTIAQLCRAMSSELRHLSTIGKNF